MALIDVQIVFENDALFASFTDGAGLELSPCSSTFLFHHAKNSSSHKVYGNNVSTLKIRFYIISFVGHQTVQQRSEFVTSTYKPYLVQALDFRNSYAEQPFVCREALDDTNSKVILLVTELFIDYSNLSLLAYFCFRRLMTM